MPFLFVRAVKSVCWFVLSLMLVACQPEDPGEDADDSSDNPVTGITEDNELPEDAEDDTDTKDDRGEISNSNGKESISIDTSGLSFELLIDFGDGAETVEISYVGDGVIIGYAPDVEPADWLRISKTGTQYFSSPVPVRFEVSTYGMDPGYYETSVRFATGRIDDDYQVIEETVVYVDMPISLRALNELELLEEKVTLYNNGTSTKKKSASVGVTGSWKASWQASTEDSWIQLTNAAGTIFDKDLLEFDVDASQLSAGVHTGSIRVEDQSYSGQFRTLEVEFKLDEPALMATDVGAGFVYAPAFDGQSRLSKTVTMISDGTKPMSWQTSTNQSWLTATTSGNAGDSLTISADPTGLTPGQIYYGEVSIDSTAAAPVQAIKVGLYLTDDNAQSVLEIPLSDDGSERFAADPVRPYLYMTSEAGYIDRIQIYTGEVDRFENLGEMLRQLIVSDDGSRAYVFDDTSDAIKVFSLPDFTPLDQWSLERVKQYSDGKSSLTYQRIFNKNLLLCPAKNIRDADTGAILVEMLDDHRYFETGTSQIAHYAPVADGESFYMTDKISELGGSGGGEYLYRHELDYSVLGELLEDTETDTYKGDYTYGIGFSSVRDIAVDQAGDNIYLIMINELLSYQFDGESLSAQGPLGSASSVELDQDDVMITGGARLYLSGDNRRKTKKTSEPALEISFSR